MQNFLSQLEFSYVLDKLQYKLSEGTQLVFIILRANMHISMALLMESWMDSSVTDPRAYNRHSRILQQMSWPSLGSLLHSCQRTNQNVISTKTERKEREEMTGDKLRVILQSASSSQRWSTKQ